MLALPTVAEKSPGQRTAPPCTRCGGSPRVTLERGDLRSQDTPEPQECSSQARPATSGDGWCPSSKARASGFAVSPVARPRSRHACRTTTEVVAGDLLDPGSLDRALARIDVAYYLVHSMGAHGDYLETDCVAARNFGDAARRTGVRRIVYLGGLATGEAALSKHLKSRNRDGRVAEESGVPVVEFRASVVIGLGSLSFELIRALVDRLPVMICPRWVSTLAQPIGIDDLLAYLVSALDLPDGDNRMFEVGGADQASYGDLMWRYAGRAG